MRLQAIVLGMSLFFFPVSSSAVTYYVASTGNNLNSCTSATKIATAKQSIQAGVDCATAPGDTIVVLGGTYSENVVSWPASGTSGNPITLKANSGDTVNWRTTTTSIASFTGQVTIDSRSYIRIEGFRFENAPTRAVIRVIESDTNKTDGDFVVGIEIVNNTFVNNGHPHDTDGDMSFQIYFQWVGRDPSVTTNNLNLISGNSFIGNYGSNITLSASSNTRVANNVSTGNLGSRNISNANWYQSSLILVTSAGTHHNLVEGNTVSDVTYQAYMGSINYDAAGIRCDVAPRDSVFRDNVIHDIGQSGGGIRAHMRGVFLEADCSNNQVYNNVVYNIGAECMREGSPQVTRSFGNQWLNNTVSTCGRHGFLMANSQNATVKNNILMDAAFSEITVYTQSVGLGGHTFSNNLYFNSGRTHIGVWNNSNDIAANLTLAGWNPASRETNSVSGNPLFINAPLDFHLSSNSPACRAGEGGVNIGAYPNEACGKLPPPPPSSSPLLIPGRIEAENYNTGGQNVGYFDTTITNVGGACTTDSVDLKDVSGEGCTIGYTEAGEWLSYTVNVQNTGSYSTYFRVANGSGSAQTIHLELDGTNISGPISIASAGSYSTQFTTTGPTLNLTQGTHNFKLYFDTGLLDLNWIDFQAQAPSIPAAPSAAQVSVLQ